MFTTNLTTVSASSQSQITPEIAEALKTSRHIEFRLEAEYFALDWEARMELAAELYALCDNLPSSLPDDLADKLADTAASVGFALEDESEDFSTWDARSDAARRVRQIVRALESSEEVRVHA